MFPMIFFAIGTIMFAKTYGMSSFVDPVIFQICMAFSVAYIIYFFVLIIFYFVKTDVSNY